MADTSRGGMTLILHCRICLRELADMIFSIAPADYSQIDVGTNRYGDLFVWCRRHSAPVIQIKNADLSVKLKEVGDRSCQGDNHIPAH